MTIINMKTICILFHKLLLAAFLLTLLSLETLQAQSGIYVGGHFRRERNHTINDLKASGFTYVILFNVNVEPNGDLKTDGEMIVTNGTYVFGNTQPNYISDVNSLKTGVTSINRVEYCIGGWGNTSYDNIRNLVNAQGTGVNSILYKNFKALKNTIPSVDAINNDDEHAYHAASATAFHVMLADIGFKTSIAPYMNRPYWQSLVTNVNNQRGGAVDKIYLQTYEGGAGLNACDWRLNNIEMHTGDLYYENATTVINKMTHNKNNCGSRGGFIWVYNDNNINLKEQAKRINDIFGIRTKNMQEVANFFNDCNYMGFANGLEAGDYNLSRLQSFGITNDVISSMTVAEGFEVVLYDGANFDGVSQVISGNNACLVGAGWNDKAASLKIRSKGATDLAGTYYLKNRHSGLNMDVMGGVGATGNGANIQQWNVATTANQQFQFTHLGDGTYKVLAMHSMKSLDIDGIKKNDGANVQQWTYYGTLNQQFVMVPTGDGYYKMIAKHSGKVVEVAGANTAPDANVQQWANNNQTCGMWKLVPIQAVNGSGDGLTANYFNGKIFETPVYSRKDATVNFDWGTGSPNTAVNIDQFSARWTGQIQPRYSGTYTFYSTTDDGGRLWINNQLVIDEWNDDGGTELTGTIALTAGQKYDIKLEYYENGGGAKAKLEWSSPSQVREVVPQSQLYSNSLPAISISSPINNQQYNAPASVTINATATDAGGSISKVDFYNGTTFIGSDISSPYNFTWTNVAAGTYSITSRATDNLGGVTVSAAVSIKVNAVVNQLPSVSITSPANNASFTAPATIAITANAADADGSITKVEFFNGAQKLGEDAIPPYSYSWAGVGAGTYTITAKATDNSGGNTTSSSVTVTVVVPASVGSVYEHCNFEGYGVNLALGNYTAAQLIALGAKDNDISSIKVQSGYQIMLYSEDNFLGTSLVITSDNGCLVANSFNDVATSIKVTEVVTNNLPTVSITSPVNNAAFNAPATITINATASDAGGTVSKVDFYNGAVLLGSDNTSPYSYTWSNVAAGTYSITARATDNNSAVATSAAVSVKVNTVVVNQPPSASIISPANNASYTAPASISITASASDADGSITKVEFFNGTQKLGEDAIAPYAYSWSGVAAGTYTISSRATDNSGATSTSASVTVTIKSATTDICTNVAQYVENNGYVAASKVKNAGRLYECKEYPYSGWCNGAAWAYAPGTGAYWQDAWYDKGACTATKMGNVSSVHSEEAIAIAPNPVANELGVQSNIDMSGGKIRILNSLGVELLNVEAVPFIDVSSLSSGIYTLVFIKNELIITKQFVK